MRAISQRPTTRTPLSLVVVVALLSALISVGVAPAAGGTTLPGSANVEVVAPTTDAPTTVLAGDPVEIVFRTDRRLLRYEVAVRSAGDAWQPAGGDATGTVVRGDNTVEVTMPDGLAPGDVDLRVRLLAPGPVDRVLAEAVEVAAVRIAGPDAVVTTDFKEQAPEVGIRPAEWSEFRTPGDWTLQNAPRRLQADIAAGGRQGLMWDAPGDDGVVEGDVEVAGLVRGAPTGNALFQLALHASGDGSDYYYLDAWPANGNVRINRLANGEFTTLSSGSAGVEVSPDTWYQVVLRREGDELAAKLWPHGEAEPEDWQVTVTDDTHDAGRVGVTHLDQGTVNDWAWFSVAVDGLQAERAPDDVFVPAPDAEPIAVEVSPQEAVAAIGGTVQLSATTTWSDGSGQPTASAVWTSADEDVATVDEDGMVTGVDEGATDITATDGEVSGTATVVIDDDHVETPEGSLDYGPGQLDTSEGGMVVAADDLATQIGQQVLADGGNAVDAAVATAYALAVVEPSMSHLGGRAQMLIRLPDGEYVGIDGGTEVPSNYDPDLAPPSHESGRGYGTIALPGVVAALAEAHEDHGDLPIEEVMAPAAELASEGFPLAARQADFLAELATVDDPQYEAAQGYFLQPDGSPYEAGDTLVQEDLATVLEAIATDGPEVFYDGWVADAIVADMEEFGGFLTAEELAGYETLDGVVLEGRYQDHELYSLYDPSRGQVTIQALQMLDHLDRADCAPEAGWASIVHQAYLLGMEDRSLPPEEVTSREHAERRAADVVDHCDPDVAGVASPASTSSVADPSVVDPSVVDPAVLDEQDPEQDSPHTTHLSTADPDGMAVTLTQTIGPGNGSMVATDGLGFLYASTMGYAGSTPGTRPSTNLNPMIVERDGELAYVIGAAGGARIITAVLMTFARTFEEGVPFAEAMAAPRLHGDDETAMRVEHDPAAGVFWPQETLGELGDLGYSLPRDAATATGRAHGIEYDADSGIFRGVADPRREGTAAGP